MNNTRSDGKLYCDSRLFGVERWYYDKPKDADMRVPDEILESICFLCVKVQGEGSVFDHFIGTGCFIQIPSTLTNMGFCYLLTDKHVIEGAKDAGYKDIFVRLNTRNGGSATFPLPDKWSYPKNPSVDLAVIPVTPDERIFEIKSIPADLFASQQIIQEHGLGVGDDLVIVGLFSQRWGHRRNIPVVRSGNIAAMPSEPFVDESGNTYDAYLAEM